MDAKRLAIVLGITVLLPLFLGVFVDAIYSEPTYDKFCGTPYYDKPIPVTKPDAICTYNSPAEMNCSAERGMPRFTYDKSGCQVFDKCDYCQKDFDQARQVYNRNTFFILAPIGLIVVILGIFLTVEYIGAGLMFGGLITMFYATVRYFSDLSKILRALVILVELLIIMWIAYKKIEQNPPKKKKR